SHTGHLLLIPIPPLFLLHTYFDHRDLHSFPTRRSSDLSSPGLRSGTPSEVPFRSRQEVVTGAMRDGERGVFESDIWRPALEKYADRKSTRLNSSHVAISYAVFCLKKKKAGRIYVFDFSL